MTQILIGHVLDRLRELPSGSIHCCITSPPYWGLRDYKTEPLVWERGDRAMWPQDHEEHHWWPDGFCRVCRSWRGSLGLEPTIELYLEHMIDVFRAVRRVLRDDATCWVNMGDSYAGAGHGPDAKSCAEGPPSNSTLPGGNLCQMPTRFALAMQADGWILRSRIIWAKGLSFCDSYSGSVMPESVNGWRWERCRVKLASGPMAGDGHPSRLAGGQNELSQALNDQPHIADWSDCPGCPKCEPNGGYVLRKGSWRPTSAYEEILLFAKTGSYFCDAEAVREESACQSWNSSVGFNQDNQRIRQGAERQTYGKDAEQSGRNLRNCWVINPQPFPDAHFATYPEALIKPIIQAATSEKGVCPECGAQWCRVVDSERIATRPMDTPYKLDRMANKDHGRHVKESSTLGWRPTCGCWDKYGTDITCPPTDPLYGGVPIDAATILDPFLGSGTTALVAKKLGRNCIGIELNADYAEMARKRIGDYAPLFTNPGGDGEER